MVESARRSSDSTTGRACVYCGRGSHLTNEHVFPDCFVKTHESITTAKTPKGEKAIRSALEIHDVCAICNSGPLSQLDTHFCKLNERYFTNIIHPGDCVRFDCDPELLLRILLKIGFNVARVRKWPLGIWEDAAPYILGQTHRPVGLRVFLQLMIPTRVEETTLPFSPGTTEIPPLPIRVYLADMGKHSGLISGYSVSVWSYRFFVLRENSKVPHGIRSRAIAEWFKDTKGACEITTRGIAKIYASSVRVLDDAATSPTFVEQLSLARKLHAETESK
jgi:hypothetical protein